MRQLKYHENKLLKKVDLFQWKSESNHIESKVIRQYHLQNREDYIKYRFVYHNRGFNDDFKLCYIFPHLNP